ncbi:MAG: hypothetical protein PVS3B1_36400 [Ktedonobacteraceae bacterium]
MQGVQRTHMVDMGVGQQNACDWQTQLLRLLHDRLRLAAYRCIDQRKIIMLAYQVAIDGTEVGQTKQVVALLCNFHG